MNLRDLVAPARLLCLVCTTVLTTISLQYRNEAQAQTTAAPVTSLVFPMEKSSAMLHFNEGQQANNQEVIDPTLPAVPGPVSPWTLTQWNHDVYILPTDLQTSQTATGPQYSFVATDQKSALTMRTVTGEPGLVFNLYNGDGTLSNAGGRALYLSTNLLPSVTSTFDHEVDLYIDTRVAYAMQSFETSSAMTTGAVLAMGYTGTGILFTDPVTNSQQFVFMQMSLTQSGQPVNVSRYMCSGSTVTLFSPKVLSGNMLPFKTDTGPLHHLKYNLSAAVQDMLSNSVPCDGVTPSWTAAQRNPANWQLTGMYFGSETENTDLRPGVSTNLPQGHAILDIDVGNLQIIRR